MNEQEALNEITEAVVLVLNSKKKINYAMRVAAKKALETIQAMKERNITPEIILEYAQFEDECVKKGFSFSSLLEAREKQIPKKPIDKIMYLECPRCGNVGILDSAYCDECGQKLDWGNRDE